MMKNKYEIRNDVVAVLMPRKDGRVTETLVSLSDLPKLEAFPRSWSAVYKNEKGGKKEYVSARAERGKGNNSRIALHRYLTDAPKGLVVDHINGNPLDNRQENLRICDQASNMQNFNGLASDNKSGVRGVNWYKAYSKWRASWCYRGKRYHVGYFDDIKEAEKAIETKKREILGDA
jgi:hypothetical protein